MLTIDAAATARDLLTAYVARQQLQPLSARDPAFDLTAAYAVEAELVRLRAADGKRPVGRKVGYANKAIWRALKLETLVWAHMYDDTVRYADGNTASVPIAPMCSPKIEPEIVFKIARPPDETADAAQVLASVEWIALGFEIIDCPFVDWKFQPADFVAAFGLHAALIVGEPRSIEPGTIPALVDQLAQFKVRLARNGEVVEEGAGRNSLRSPALCLGELAAAIRRRLPHEPLAPAELVSSGTLTESRPIAARETWTATVEGIDLPALTLAVQ